mmetsp:Transcript_23992/g.46795  ORF Transcript_23992/g.46795 Transcript_23992/m.46795 type:complete len:237 (-) Transcript_23992:174-884(-)
MEGCENPSSSSSLSVLSRHASTAFQRSSTSNGFFPVPCLHMLNAHVSPPMLTTVVFFPTLSCSHLGILISSSRFVIASLSISAWARVMGFGVCIFAKSSPCCLTAISVTMEEPRAPPNMRTLPSASYPDIWKLPPPESHTRTSFVAASDWPVRKPISPSRSCSIHFSAIPVLVLICVRKPRPLAAFRNTAVATPRSLSSWHPCARAILAKSAKILAPLLIISGLSMPLAPLARSCE